MTSLTAVEGCQVDSLYMLRHIDEFPPDQYAQERDEGYDKIVIRFEYYTRLRSDAQCGKHRSNPAIRDFNPMKIYKKFRKIGKKGAMALTDFPPDFVARAEAHISAIVHIEENRKTKTIPRLELKRLDTNSLWYYSEGRTLDYNMKEPIQLGAFNTSILPSQLVIPASDEIKKNFTLRKVLRAEEFEVMQDFLSGKPLPNYDSTLEPGGDVLDVTKILDDPIQYIFNSGLDRRPLDGDFLSRILNPDHFALVGIAIKPFESVTDVLFSEPQTVPQIRLVYQLMDWVKPGRPLEQLYFHLNFDAVDRYAAPETRASQHQQFLEHIAIFSTFANEMAKQIGLNSILRKVTARPVDAFAFSSTLSGNWIFGALSRSENREYRLKPMRIKREGIDYGYYSSVYDNDLLRKGIQDATEEPRKTRLTRILEDQIVTDYRDAKRIDVHALNFQRVTCAQCHQTAARDGVHMSFNDHIDKRFTYPIIATEFVHREAQRQLQRTQKWLEGLVFTHEDDLDKPLF